jgi:long-subunit acyl-CoA synthetase (AMP-forming)
MLIAEEFSPENGTLTHTMKVRRRAVEDRYRARIDELYSQADAVPVAGHISG